uniref:Uncharacterized protein n=1 Tax=Oryza sativa subsp. japonica TaxID=39947 RepID=Q8L564_ORYSJ|nr:hypothetical protein [Oryza sativa Japonica Group]BAD30447.1 hypothetical protein [Oryza sativa Japonica Group]
MPPSVIVDTTSAHRVVTGSPSHRSPCQRLWCADSCRIQHGGAESNNACKIQAPRHRIRGLRHRHRRTITIPAAIKAPAAAETLPSPSLPPRLYRCRRLSRHRC